MAKIENTTVYPTVLPSMEDLLIATDVSDNNETVTFLVSDLIGGTGVLQGLQSVLDTVNIATQTMDLTGDINLLGGPGVGFLETCQIKLAGGYGTPGDVVTSKGPGECAIWEAPAAVSCCSWNDSLLIGNIATTKSIIDGVKMEVINAGGGIDILSPATLTNSGISTFTGEVKINGTDLNFNATGQINDSAGTTGAVGEWLTATATGVEWSSTIPPASCCDIQDVLGIGSTAFDQGISFTGTSSVTFAAGVSIGSSGNNIWSGTNTFNGVVEINDCLEDSLGTCGAAGQVLISTGTAVQWSTGAGIGAQNLQGVLDTAPFGATGVNANVTISGTLEAGTITDNSGSTGALNQVLSISGAGLTWATPGAAGVIDVNDGVVGPSTGLPIVTSPTSGNVVITQMRYTGGLNEGCVPRGSANDATKYLDGTGAWTVPAGGGGAVTSFTNSNGTFISAGTVNAAATGAVTVGTLDLSAAGVPSASTFLRGDNTWASPTAATDTNSQELIFTNRLQKFGPPYTAGTYMGISSAMTSGFSPIDVWNDELSGSPAVSSPTLIETFVGSVFRVPTDGCTTGKPNFTICSISTAGVLSVVDTSPTVLTIEVWKTGDPCVSGDTYLVATCNMSITTAGTPICCESGTVESGGSQIFTPGDTMLITWRMDQDITTDSLYQIWKLWIRGEWTA